MIEEYETKEIIQYWKKRETQILDAMELEANKISKRQSKPAMASSGTLPEKVNSAPAPLVQVQSKTQSPTSSSNSLETEQFKYYAIQGISLFNTLGFYGIDYLLNHFFELKDLPLLFYDYREQVDPLRLGLWLADNSEYMPMYLSMYQFKEILPIDALRNVLGNMRLPSGTGILTIFLKAFVAKYIHDNKDLPTLHMNESGATKLDAFDLYTLLYASVMVHSELSHSLAVASRRKKRRFQQFWTLKKFEKILLELTSLPLIYISQTYKKIMTGFLIIPLRNDLSLKDFKGHRRNEEWDAIKSENKVPIEHKKVVQERYLEALKTKYSTQSINNQKSTNRGIEISDKPLLQLSTSFDEGFSDKFVQ